MAVPLASRRAPTRVAVDDAGTTRSGHRFAVTAVPAGVAAALALPTLGRQPLSWDEAVTADVAGRSVSGILGVIRHTDSPLTSYYLLMHAWVRLGCLVGVGPLLGQEVWLRLPSVAMAVVAVCALSSLVSRWCPRRVAMTAGVLLAVHPMLQFYAQDARPYTAVTAAVIGSVAAADRVAACATRRAWTVWVLATLAVGYLHLFALPAAVAGGAGVLLARRARPSQAAVVAGCAVALGVLPLVVLGAGQTGEVGWIPSAGAAGVAHVLLHAAGGVGVLAAWCAVAVFAWRTGRSRAPSLALWSWLGVPPVVLVLADLVVPVLVARYLLVCLPAACVLVASGVTRTAGARRRVLLGAVVVASVATVGVQDAAPFKYADYRAVVDVLGDRLQAGDAVLYVPIATRVGITRYAGLEPDDAALVGADVSRASGTASTLAGPVAPAAVTQRRLAAARRVFVIGDPGSVGNFRPPRGRRYVWSQRFGVVEVVEYAR